MLNLLHASYESTSCEIMALTVPNQANECGADNARNKTRTTSDGFFCLFFARREVAQI